VRSVREERAANFHTLASKDMEGGGVPFVRTNMHSDERTGCRGSAIENRSKRASEKEIL